MSHRKPISAALTSAAGLLLAAALAASVSAAPAPTPPWLDQHLPPEERASQTGPGTANQCNSLLTAATKHNATPADVAAIFTTKSDADVDTATNQLSLAGLLAT